MASSSGIAYRAGRYVRQRRGYPAFMPAPLPPEPPIQLEGDVRSLLSEADIALGRLDGTLQILPNPDLFMFMYVRKEAVLSSQIEGTQSSLQDLLAAEAQLFVEAGAKDVAEVINYVRAMNFGLERLNELPLSLRLLCEIHAQLLQGVRGSKLTPGELRTSQNWIGPAGCALREAVFVPPPPHEVPRALGQLELFLRQPGDLPALVWIGLAHAQFETIHPFLDGNGRVGRLLITFLLRQQKLLQKPVLYLSYYFKRHRARYYDELQAVRDRGTWESWLLFFLQGIVDVSQQATLTVRRILHLREEHQRLIIEHGGYAAGRCLQVLEHLYRHPIISINDVKRLTATAYPSANNLVKRMVECRILQEFTGQARNRKFGYQSYIDLLQEDP